MSVKLCRICKHFLYLHETIKLYSLTIPISWALMNDFISEISVQILYCFCSITSLICKLFNKSFSPLPRLLTQGLHMDYAKCFSAISRNLDFVSTCWTQTQNIFLSIELPLLSSSSILNLLSFQYLKHLIGFGCCFCWCICFS